MQNIATPEVKFGDWISEGWRMFTEQWKAWVLNTAIYFGIVFLPITAFVAFVYIYILSLSSSYRSYPPRSAPPVGAEFPIIIFVGAALLGIFVMLASAFLTGGMYRTAMKQLRGGIIEVRDLFSGTKDFMPILGYHFLAGLLIMIGAMLCIIPGYIVLGALFFSIPLILDRNLGVIQAMQTSFELTKKNLLMFTLFAFVVALIAQVGTYACYIGILATLPLQFTITAVAFRDCFGLEGAKRFLPNALPTPGSYGQPMSNPYQPPYQQGGFNAPPAYEQGRYNAPPYPPAPQNYNPPPPQGYASPPPNYEANYTEPSPPNFVPPAAPTGTVPLDNLAESAPTEKMPKPATPSDSVSNPSAGQISCANCQASLPATAVFCPRCGTRTKP